MVVVVVVAHLPPLVEVVEARQPRELRLLEEGGLLSRLVAVEARQRRALEVHGRLLAGEAEGRRLLQGEGVEKPHLDLEDGVEKLLHLEEEEEAHHLQVVEGLGHRELAQAGQVDRGRRGRRRDQELVDQDEQRGQRGRRRPRGQI